MPRRFPIRVQYEQEGFTLIELLVVILIIGILAAIALPAFLGQRAKAQDAESKSDVRNTTSLLEACSTSNDGSYTGCDSAITPLGGASVQVVAAGKSYKVEDTSASDNVFKFVKQPSAGNSQRQCVKHNAYGSCSSGTW